MYIGNNSVCLPQLSHPATSHASQECSAVQSQQVAAVEWDQNSGAKRTENVMCNPTACVGVVDKRWAAPQRVWLDTTAGKTSVAHLHISLPGTLTQSTRSHTGTHRIACTLCVPGRAWRVDGEANTLMTFLPAYLSFHLSAHYICINLDNKEHISYFIQLFLYISIYVDSPVLKPQHFI